MSRSASRFSGWSLVGWCALVLGTFFAAELVVAGTGEAGIRAVVRRSAQTSLVLFCSAFTASSLAQLRPGPITRWMLRNRRYLGVSFAASHTYHLLALVALARVSPAFVESLNAVTLVGGGMAYVFIAAMVATSFDRSAAWLGPRRWKVLHTVGMYYIWIIFLQSYLPRAVVSPAYIPAAMLLLIALFVRVAARRSRQQRSAVVRPVSARAAGG
jgi:sulfoxide reductase heme-binding subunit YedZ